MSKTQSFVEDEKLLSKPVLMIKLSKDNKFLALAMAGGKTVHIIEIESNKTKVTLSRGFLTKAMIRAMDFSFDNRFFALVSD